MPESSAETITGWMLRDMKRGAQVALTNALDGLRQMRVMAAGSDQEPGLDIAIVFMEGLVSAGATPGLETTNAD